jgi:hypothetical protein
MFPDDLLIAICTLEACRKQYTSAVQMVSKLRGNVANAGDTPWYQGMVRHWEEEERANAEQLHNALASMADAINRAYA